MSKYVPTTATVIATYAAAPFEIDVPDSKLGETVRDRERAALRWLSAELDAAEKRGWDECVNEAGDLGLIHDIGVREMLARNPHRADRIEEGT